MANYLEGLERLPEYMHGGIVRYIENGIPPGDFLSAVICNDLTKAFLATDDTNRYILHDYVNYFYWNAPSGCWGSKEAFNSWIANGGLKGNK